mmetsp:Transcript_64028/g.128702  ORF Transcript_64028/g.128702 Transcript_64028/m.128702 type:complete len:500 (+) Transcript_64028:861-2360(+)
MALASCTISGVSVLLLVGPFFLSPPSPSPPPPPLPSKNVLSSSKNVLSPVSELCRKGFPWLRDKCRLSSLCLLSKITPDSAISRNAVRKATRSSPSSHRKEEVAAAEKPPLLLPLLLPFLPPLLLLLPAVVIAAAGIVADGVAAPWLVWFPPPFPPFCPAPSLLPPSLPPHSSPLFGLCACFSSFTRVWPFGPPSPPTTTTTPGCDPEAAAVVAAFVVATSPSSSSSLFSPSLAPSPLLNDGGEPSVHPSCLSVTDPGDDDEEEVTGEVRGDDGDDEAAGEEWRVNPSRVKSRFKSVGPVAVGLLLPLPLPSKTGLSKPGLSKPLLTKLFSLSRLRLMLSAAKRSSVRGSPPYPSSTMLRSRASISSADGRRALFWCHPREINSRIAEGSRMVVSSGDFGCLGVDDAAAATAGRRGCGGNGGDGDDSGDPGNEDEDGDPRDEDGESRAADPRSDPRSGRSPRCATARWMSWSERPSKGKRRAVSSYKRQANENTSEANE